MEQLLHIDKLASSTVNLHLDREILISDEIVAEKGVVCIVKALEEKRVYDRLELITGRMAKIFRGDIIAGVLGERRALQGFVGVVPDSIRKGDVLNILNLGGIIGKAISYSMDFGEPLKVEVIGVAQRDGKVLSIKEYARKISNRLESKSPIVVVSGTSMNSGKTCACSTIIQELTWKGHRVCGAKVTGISALKDTLNMEDHGAVKAISFLDYGYPSTVRSLDVPLIAKGALNDLSDYDPDVTVVELGDGILGDYGVMEFFKDREILKGITCHVGCAIDPVGAWGLKEIVKNYGIPFHLVSGPVTDNLVGVEFIERSLGLGGINAIYQRQELGDFIERMVKKSIKNGF